MTAGHRDGRCVSAIGGAVRVQPRHRRPRTHVTLALVAVDITAIGGIVVASVASSGTDSPGPVPPHPSTAPHLPPTESSAVSPPAPVPPALGGPGDRDERARTHHQPWPAGSERGRAPSPPRRPAERHLVERSPDSAISAPRHRGAPHIARALGTDADHPAPGPRPARSLYTPPADVPAASSPGSGAVPSDSASVGRPAATTDAPDRTHPPSARRAPTVSSAVRCAPRRAPDPDSVAQAPWAMPFVFATPEPAPSSPDKDDADEDEDAIEQARPHGQPDNAVAGTGHSALAHR